MICKSIYIEHVITIKGITLSDTLNSGFRTFRSERWEKVDCMKDGVQMHH